MSTNKVTVHIVADAVASTWLTLSAVDGADGLTIGLDKNTPIDVQLAQFVHERQTLRNSFGISGGGGGGSSSNLYGQNSFAAGGGENNKNQNNMNSDANRKRNVRPSTKKNAADQEDEDDDDDDFAVPLPPPATLGILTLRGGGKRGQQQSSSPSIPKPRSLGLDAMLMYSDTLLPGVDSSAATSSSSQDLINFVNASGTEASPWQIVHSGCTISEINNVAGAVPLSARERSEMKKLEEEQVNKTRLEDGAEEQNQQQHQHQPLTLVLVGDLLSYCSKDIFQMIGSMTRPFRRVAPKVIEKSLVPYCAHDSVLVARGLGVARDGCTVWRMSGGGGGDGGGGNNNNNCNRRPSVIGATASDALLPQPAWENGCAVFVNHPVGPACLMTAEEKEAQEKAASAGGGAGGGGGGGDAAAKMQKIVSGSQKKLTSLNQHFRRVLRITWTDAFLGAEHGGAEGRRRFSAPHIAIGLLHSSQVHQAIKHSETSGHVFGNMKDSVMWCMSPDAALFPGPHLHPVRGPPFQCQPHLYVPNPMLETFTGKTRNRALATVSSASQQQKQKAEASASPAMNPTVISTTVTILCDPSMNCVTFLNSGRRVASWDLSEIWAVRLQNRQRSESSESSNGEEGEAAAAAASGQQKKKKEDLGLESIFYPVVDVGAPGAVVEIVS